MNFIAEILALKHKRISNEALDEDKQRFKENDNEKDTKEKLKQLFDLSEKIKNSTADKNELIVFNELMEMLTGGDNDRPNDTKEKKDRLMSALSL